MIITYPFNSFSQWPRSITLELLNVDFKKATATSVDLSQNWFIVAVEVKCLTFHNINIERINSDAFNTEQFAILSALGIQRAPITCISSGAFHGLLNLKELILRHLLLMEVSTDFLSPVKNLAFLEMSSCSSKTLEQIGLHNLPKVIEMEIANFTFTTKMSSVQRLSVQCPSSNIENMRTNIFLTKSFILPFSRKKWEFTVITSAVPCNFVFVAMEQSTERNEISRCVKSNKNGTINKLDLDLLPNRLYRMCLIKRTAKGAMPLNCNVFYSEPIENAWIFIKNRLEIILIFVLLSIHAFVIGLFIPIILVKRFPSLSLKSNDKRPNIQI